MSTVLEKPKNRRELDFPPDIPVMTPELLQQAIEEADREDAEGLLIPHEVVMEEARQWLRENPSAGQRKQKSSETRS